MNADVARAGVVEAVAGLPTATAALLLLGVADGLLVGQGEPLGPNATLPCGTESARRRHLAHGRTCAECGVDDASTV